MTQKVVQREYFDKTLKGEEKNQRLYSDVMQIDMKKFLITVVCEPLQLTM
jgi:hypothetical protein